MGSAPDLKMTSFAPTSSPEGEVEFERLQALLLEPRLSGLREQSHELAGRLASLEHQLENSEALVDLLRPLVGELLQRQLEDGADVLTTIVAAVIDQAIALKLEQDYESLVESLAPTIAQAISLQTQLSPEAIGRAIAPEIAVALREHIQLHQGAIAQELAPEIGMAIRAQIRLEQEEIATALAPVMGLAIQEQIKLARETLAQALAPVMSLAIQEQIRSERDSMVDALYPIIGSTVARYLAETLQEINRKLESAFSPEGMRRKLQAKLQGVSEAELLLRESTPFQVQAVFLIHKASGLVMAEVQRPEVELLEAEMVAGMLTAIRSFVGEYIARSDLEADLNEIEYGNAKVILEVAGYCYLAVVVNGVPTANFLKKLRQTLTDLVDSYGEPIKNFSGDLTSLPEAMTGQLLSLTQTMNLPSSQGKNYRQPPVLVLAIVAIFWLLLLVPWGMGQYQDYCDRLLTTELNQLLANQAELALYRIQAVSQRQQVRLAGYVPAPELKETAETLVRQQLSTVAGDRQLDNGIIVMQLPAPPPPEPPAVLPVLSEHEIGAEVQRVAAILNRLGPMRVVAQYYQGQVRLESTVQFLYQVKEINRAFEQIPGIKSVTNTVKQLDVSKKWN